MRCDQWRVCRGLGLHLGGVFLLCFCKEEWGKLKAQMPFSADTYVTCRYLYLSAQFQGITFILLDDPSRELQHWASTFYLHYPQQWQKLLLVMDALKTVSCCIPPSPALYCYCLGGKQNNQASWKMSPFPSQFCISPICTFTIGFLFCCLWCLIGLRFNRMYYE